MNSRVWLTAQFTAVGLLIASVAVRLVMGRVPPNRLYGFRTAKTLSEERIWYAANRVAGWDLLVAGLIIAAALVRGRVSGLRVARHSRRIGVAAPWPRYGRARDQRSPQVDEDL
jgi:uncharacterized membrane protein YedE/YeeE